MAKALFYYLIDLHYSQTHAMRDKSSVLFYYLIDLHYSQTYTAHGARPM